MVLTDVLETCMYTSGINKSASGGACLEFQVLRKLRFVDRCSEWWCMLRVPSTQKAEARGSLPGRTSRSSWISALQRIGVK
uniref:Uncharacterized protein n=1 Tax=Spermophilus dauricus TaxID=99837 RepID=A0A8C9UL41_SPEDA